MTIRSLLSDAHGYEVVDAEGRRVGSFIELAGGSESDGEHLAIRRDRIFLWHRLVLPLDAVERVVPERRVVVLALNRKALDHPEELENEVWPSTADGQSRTEWLAGRLEHYVPSAAEAAPVEQRTQHAAPEARGATRPGEQHLLFFPTPDGYFLAERDGPPPPVAGTIDAPELPGSFSVTKLARSPLPDDARICAYLEPRAAKAADEARGR